MATTCPLCESGALQSALVDESINYAGSKLLVKNVAISRCDTCGEELVLPEQVRSNERLFADAKRAHDGLLTSFEIVAWRNRWNLTQQQAAALLGGGVNAFSKYERGEVTQARSMDLLIRGSDRSAELRAFLSELAGVDFGKQWVSAPEEKQEVAALPVRRAAASSAGNIVMFSIRQAASHADAKNDGQWHADESFEPECAHG